MYMTISLVLLGLLSLGLAILWRRRLALAEALFATLKNKFGSDEAEISDEMLYTQCLSRQWVFKHVVSDSYSGIGEAFRNLINNRTLLVMVISALSLGPMIVLGVHILYSSFVFVGASLAIVIAAVFLINAPSSVTTSYSLLTWLKEQDHSELKKNDLPYATVALKSIIDWTRVLIAIALISLVAAPWGELLPELVALGVSQLFGLVSDVFYPALSAISPEFAFIGSMFINVLLVASVFFLLVYIARRSISGLKKLAKMEDNE